MARIGWTSCGTCGNPEASVSQTATGTLSTSCHRCEFSGFAKRGTKAHRLITAAMKADPDALPADPAPAPSPTPVPAKPVPSKQPAKTTPANSVFNLGEL